MKFHRERWPTRVGLLVRWLAVLGILALASLLPTTSKALETSASLAYSFADQDSGGVAVVEVDVASGKIVGSKILLDSPQCLQPLKVRRSEEFQVIAVTNLTVEGPHLFLIPHGRPDSSIVAHGLPSIPDEIRLAGPLALISCEEDVVVFVDLMTLQPKRIDQLDQLLDPPANKPEDIHVVADSTSAVVSFQKDSKTGKKKGNRLVVYQLPAATIAADLQLPREHPELHFPGNLKEQGPGPEVIYVSQQNDTLCVTLDLYGSLGLMKWSAARQGRVEDWQELNMAVNDTWGSAFPDRATAFTLGSRELYLVTNAGAKGGSVLIDLGSRSVLWKRATPPGLEAPVYLPTLRKAFSVCSGKTKTRDDDEVTKTLNPQRELYVFDFSSAQAVREQPVSSSPLPGFTTQIAAVSLDPPRLLIATGEKQWVEDVEIVDANSLVVYDPVQRKILDQQPAAGRIGRFER